MGCANVRSCWRVMPCSIASVLVQHLCVFGGQAVCLLVWDSVWKSCMTVNEQNKGRERKRGRQIQQGNFVTLPRTGCASSPSHSNLITPVSPLLILFSMYSAVPSPSFLTFRPCSPIKSVDLVSDKVDALNPAHDQWFTTVFNHS